MVAIGRIVMSCTLRSCPKNLDIAGEPPDAASPAGCRPGTEYASRKPAAATPDSVILAEQLD